MKYSSTRSWDRPTASKICAIVYEPTVLMPILLMTLRTPLPSALTMLRTACAGSTPVRAPSRIRSSIDSNARYGLTAAAPAEQQRHVVHLAQSPDSTTVGLAPRHFLAHQVVDGAASSRRSERARRSPSRDSTMIRAAGGDRLGDPQLLDRLGRRGAAVDVVVAVIPTAAGRSPSSSMCRILALVVVDDRERRTPAGRTPVACSRFCSGRRCGRGWSPAPRGSRPAAGWSPGRTAARSSRRAAASGPRARRPGCRCPSSRSARRRRTPSASPGCAAPPRCSRRASAGGRRTRGWPRPPALRQRGQVHQAGVQPVLVRVLGGQRALDLLVGDDLPGGGVDEEHPARLQPALGDDVGGGMSRTPTSLARTTRSSLVCHQRAGRRPLRSRTAPMSVPSVKQTAAGPSHGSMIEEWNR